MYSKTCRIFAYAVCTRCSSVCRRLKFERVLQRIFIYVIEVLEVDAASGGLDISLWNFK